MKTRLKKGALALLLIGVLVAGQASGGTGDGHTVKNIVVSDSASPTLPLHPSGLSQGNIYANDIYLDAIGSWMGMVASSKVMTGTYTGGGTKKINTTDFEPKIVLIISENVAGIASVLFVKTVSMTENGGWAYHVSFKQHFPSPGYGETNYYTDPDGDGGGIKLYERDTFGNTYFKVKNMFKGAATRDPSRSGRKYWFVAFGD